MAIATLTALHDTAIKKSTEQSSKLPDTEKKIYKAGETISIDKVESAPNGHLKVTLSFGAGVWYIFEKDWSPIPESMDPVESNSKVPEQAVQIITEFEGFVPHVYNDGVGVATIGIGTTRYPNGKPVRFGDPNITLETAQSYLSHDLENTVNHLAASIPHWNEMNDNQRSALISFAYNLGDYFYGNPGFNSITSALRDKRWNDVPKVLELYSNPGSNVHEGLLRRRKAEGELWQGKGKFAK